MADPGPQDEEGIKEEENKQNEEFRRYREYERLRRERAKGRVRGEAKPSDDKVKQLDAIRSIKDDGELSIPKTSEPGKDERTTKRDKFKFEIDELPN